MAQMTERMMELFNTVRTVVLSTSTEDGVPNAVPVGMKRILDNETILISNQYLNKTLSNMQSNSQIAVTFWEGREGYQLKGRAVVETVGCRYEETAAWISEVSAKTGRPMRSKGAVILTIEEIYSVAPGPGAGKRIS